ncbi:type IV toxin-antitoxin system AbiEi family antitoxin domain-containing protein [Cryobacterium sp. W22_MBD10_FK3]|uniref:type IV toxin-antitoxin system AbiEi family antitoxin domain-containing protein n=1 Tax=Cryobacterium sp. W22_MBD10_FK3 TaxID=3240273 RepID=UPI003F911C97
MTDDRLDPRTGLFLVKGIGVSDTDARMFRRSVDHGQGTRLRRGVFTTADRWAGLTARDRYLDHIRAVIATRRHDPVVSHQSAAALWGIPLGGAWPGDVHVLAVPATRVRSKNGVFVHRTAFDWDDVVELDGVLVTSPARTLLDLARTTTFGDAVVAIDHAINPRRATPEVLVYADELSELLARCGSLRGSTKAQRAIDFARPDADNPGESLSRVAIFELGFPDPELQCRHPNPRGGWYFTDFEWRRFRLIGEFDGRGKYLKEEFLRGRTPGDAVYDEKVREDHLRAEGFRVVRWGPAELADRGALSRRLIEAGLPAIR